MGLVVTYKTSGVFNFAHGAVGMAATFVFYSLRAHGGLPTWLAAGIAVLAVGPAIGVVIDRLLLRRLEGAPSATYVVVSLGLLIATQSLFLVLYGAAPRRVEPFLPQSTFRLPGVNVGWDQFILRFAVLVFSPKGKFLELTRTDQRAVRVGSVAAGRFPVRLLVALALMAAVLPGRLSSGRLLTATAVAAFVLVFSSLGLLVGMSRQVSLCHVVFVALGETTLDRLLDAGVPYIAAMILHRLVMVLVRAVMDVL